MGALTSIEHIVVLMLENRSFDSLLGRLYPKSDSFDGLSGGESNLDSAGNLVKAWAVPGADTTTMRIPDPDPGELWTDMNEQLFETSSPGPGADCSMGGFVKSYASQRGKTAVPPVPDRVMHGFLPEQVPVLSRLARQFAVCDRWHASAPCQTWPNRLFVHTGTADGYENNTPKAIPFEMPTIFNRFEDLGIGNGWKIYFHDVPQTVTLGKLWGHLSNFNFFASFRQDASQGTLPKYSFIEPRYFPDVELPNDQHPPHVVTMGEQLIAEVYNCLRAGPAWTETLLIITYDEHGGNYDHVAPPAATPPSSTRSIPFNFDRYGVRVPAVIISPYVRQGTVLRAPGATPFDHTSILATLRTRFALGPALTQRDAVAPDLDAALNLPSATNLGPQTVEALPYVATPSELQLAKQVPLNDMQRALLTLSKLLPKDSSNVNDTLATLKARPPLTQAEADQVAADAKSDLEGAVADVRGRLSALFGSSQSP